MRYTVNPNSPYHDLELKMMKVAVRAEKKFLKNCGPEYDDYLKTIKTTPISIVISDKLIANYGIASRSDLTAKIFELSITLTHRVADYGKPLVYEIVSHELAHCLDFIIRGESYHDDEWRKIHTLMGGLGKSYIDHRELPKKGD